MITVVNPATEETIAELPEVGVEETDAAVGGCEGGLPRLARGGAG